MWTCYQDVNGYKKRTLYIYINMCVCVCVCVCVKYKANHRHSLLPLEEEERKVKNGVKWPKSSYPVKQPKGSYLDSHLLPVHTADVPSSILAVLYFTFYKF